jgi:hypothetical protein
LITGNEDGIKHCASNVLYSLQHIGYSVAPQSDAGWIGDAGPGPSYGDMLEDGSRVGQDNDFTNRNTTFMTWNLMHLARMLTSVGGFPAHGNQRKAWDAGARFDFEYPEYRGVASTAATPADSHGSDQSPRPASLDLRRIRRLRPRPTPRHYGPSTAIEVGRAPERPRPSSAICGDCGSATVLVAGWRMKDLLLVASPGAQRRLLVLSRCVAPRRPRMRRRLQVPSTTSHPQISGLGFGACKPCSLLARICPIWAGDVRWAVG